MKHCLAVHYAPYCCTISFTTGTLINFYCFNFIPLFVLCKLDGGSESCTVSEGVLTLGS